MSLDKKTEVILNECRTLEKVLNNDILTQFAKLHNIKNDHNMFKLKQELVARSAYFLNVKKKYVLYITNKEGVVTSEVYCRGIEIRRSDWPQMTKDGMSKILDLLVKEEKVSFKNIRKLISDTRTEIMQLIINRSKEIAKPVSFAKSLSEYKQIPSHVLGMLLWNDLEYEYFVPGTKGYQFKIKGVNFELAPEKVKTKSRVITSKNNNIVVPFEESTLPNYYVINADEMCNLIWDGVIEKLLEPIWGKIDKSTGFKELCFEEI